MRAKFTFDYGAVFTAEQIAALNGLIEPVMTVDEDGKVSAWGSYEGELERVLAVLPPAVRVNVTGMGDPRPLLELAEQLRGIDTRLAGLGARPENYVNHRVDVHVPGNALLAVDEVEVHPDACTEHLQECLDEGWRIVAVCPQPDQRRPDYVLGRRRPLE